MIAHAGKLLCVDRGEYSNYEVTGFFVILEDFDPMEKLSEYVKVNSDQKKRFDPDEFLAFLLSKGLLLEIDYSTLYLSGYGEMEDVRFDEK